MRERALPLATTQCIDQRFFRAIEFLNQASIAWMPTIQTMNFTDVTYCCIHLSSRRISITLGLRGGDVTPLMRPALSSYESRWNFLFDLANAVRALKPMPPETDGLSATA